MVAFTDRLVEANPRIRQQLGGDISSNYSGTLRRAAPSIRGPACQAPTRPRCLACRFGQLTARPQVSQTASLGSRRRAGCR